MLWLIGGAKVLGVIRNFTRCVLALTLLAVAAGAEPLPAPSGDVILTVRGQISQTNHNTDASLDRGLIEQIGVRTIHTGTIWTEGTIEFRGVDLSRLLVRLGAHGSKLRLTALNDYSVDLPMSDAVDGGPMLAFQMNGRDLSARDKGPLWMIYPFDPEPAYKNEVNYARSIWQLTMIEVLP